jgi:hypothetical protein
MALTSSLTELVCQAKKLFRLDSTQWISNILYSCFLSKDVMLLFEYKVAGPFEKSPSAMRVTTCI